MKALCQLSILMAVFLSSCDYNNVKPENIQRKINQARSNVEQPFIVPAILMDGNKVGDLILGKTTLKQALDIMPAYPGYEPKTSPFTNEQVKGIKLLGIVGETILNTKMSYNPMNAMYILIFNKDDRLVIIQRDFLPSNKSEFEEINNIYAKYKIQLKEIYRDAKVIRMQGEIQPCIILEIFFEYNKDKEILKPYRVGYVYTCQDNN